MESKTFWEKGIKNGSVVVGKGQDLITCEFQEQNIFSGRGNEQPMYKNIYKKYWTNMAYKEDKYSNRIWSIVW